MQRESTFRLEPLPLTDGAKKHVEKIRRLAVDLFDAVHDIEYAAKTEKNAAIEDVMGCVAIAKNKIQEATFWANRGASYLGHEFKEI